MKALVTLPESGRTSCFTDLFDRPFLCHIVEFLVDSGIRDIVIAGSGFEQARAVLGPASQWDAAIEYRERAGSPAAIANGENLLLASAACLPEFPLKQYRDHPQGLIIYCEYGDDPRSWSGWALLEPEDATLMPLESGDGNLLSWLETLPDYARLQAGSMLRCDSYEAIWKAHRDVWNSNLFRFIRGGLEVKPGVWIGRNVSIAHDAELLAPVWIGENSRISSGARIGPFAVIGRECLIAPRSTVLHAVVTRETYVGSHLDLDHVLVDKRNLFDVRLGTLADQSDGSILGGVFDFHLYGIPRRMRAAFASLAALKTGAFPR